MNSEGFVKAFERNWPVDILDPLSLEECKKSASPCLVTVTTPSPELAMSLSRQIIENRLAACVQQLPGVTSIYRWEGTVHCDEEVLLSIKTMTNHVEPLKVFISDQHPYDVPEFVVIPIVGGSENYLQWMEDCVG